MSEKYKNLNDPNQTNKNDSADSVDSNNEIDNNKTNNSKERKKHHIWITLALVVLVFLLVVFFHALKEKNSSNKPIALNLSGYTNQPVNSLTDMLSPQLGFWLGGEEFQGTFLRQTGVPNDLSEIQSSTESSREIKPILFIDYGNQDYRGTTIIAFNTSNDKYKQLIEQCWENNNCPEDFIRTESSLGKGIIKKTKANDWEAKILYKPTNQAVYVIDDSRRFDPETVLGNLTAIE